ncbi:hypothetical protein ERO13_D06G041600v2 [Gossypium hirsutum]|uniref:Uncharacterized protein n=6 Tax=Gossypium TaxID=3633 RepID=A0A1U8KMP2_GOSHI|nr:uncharacterized protein LOC107917431 [Gossypium hirsutum]KAB2023845.1 hypothetical protein ES319_D06G047600v1 [Gossypium barbadense]MBA0747360.1 hypothetical protein [Gossypium gossypioides]TYG63711.1 hypothetical protein ES288_D06G051800v1 [Gossypium darwinii]TYH65397.1 hypothetical protein ES332_D06G053100v1 [Gossypium tomentosum]TYI76029.1 hypothetical protein E1A91_D06G048400v1 [Gossypium mustelinum]
MGNRYHQQQQINSKGMFLPLLCSKPSIKDVVLPKWKVVDRSASLSEDPLSPKISCMGQVKRNNKIVGFPVSYKLSTVTPKNSSSSSFNSSTVKYFKLKKLFSGKNLTGSPATSTTAATTGCRRKQVLINGTSKPKGDDGKENSGTINIETMDPPLPVIKKGPKQGDERDGSDTTLWQRRSRGVALERLQLQQIQLNRHQEPTTV